MCQDEEVANKVRAKCEEGEKALESPKSDEDPMPVSICLRDAEVYHPSNPKQGIIVGWWRGRITKIDGFRLGTLYEKKQLLSGETPTWDWADRPKKPE